MASPHRRSTRLLPRPPPAPEAVSGVIKGCQKLLSLAQSVADTRQPSDFDSAEAHTHARALCVKYEPEKRHFFAYTTLFPDDWVCFCIIFREEVLTVYKIWVFHGIALPAPVQISHSFALEAEIPFSFR